MSPWHAGLPAGDPRARARPLSRASGPSCAARPAADRRTAGGALPLPGPSHFPATQQLLLITAAETAAQLVTVVAAAAVTGLGADALDATGSVGLIDVAATVTFRHPLVRSASTQAPTSRSSARACAPRRVTDRRVEPDAWVWHRANSASGTDEDVALALEARGLEAERGGATRPTRRLCRAPRTHLRPADPRAPPPSAATALLVAGADGEAWAHLERVQVDQAEPLVQAQAPRLRAVLTFITSPWTPWRPSPRRAVPRGSGPELSHMTYAEGLFLATLTGRFAPPGLVEELVLGALLAGAG